MKRLGKAASETYDLLLTAVGEETADLVCAKRGGRKLWITYSPKSQLVGLVGPEKAKAIYDVFGGGFLLIPLATADAFRRRRDAMAKLSSEGRSGAEIAEALGCHQRTVDRVRHTLREIDKLRMAK